jgi:hypothetical protein
MPLWRRSHDHRRDLRAQRRTPSPAIAQSWAQDRDAMTPITAFVALPAAANLASGAASRQCWLASL